MTDYKYVPVVDNQPNAAKKGLRIKVTGCSVDHEGRIKEIFFDYSEWHVRGGGIIKTERPNYFAVEYGN